jgi:hypothetical protein
MDYSKKHLAPGGLLLVAGYYPLGIKYCTGDETFDSRGLAHYERLHDSLRKYFDFDRE